MSGEYFLGTLEWGSARLRFQHELTKANLDGHVFDPSIPPLRPGMKIADVACGNGVWLLDAIESAPANVIAEGFDVNVSYFPPCAWLPESVAFHQLDILKDLPDEIVEKYDVVNAQFSSSFVRDTQSEQFMRSLVRMLKPGGHLQLTESDVTRWSWLTADNSDSPLEMLKLYSLIDDIFGGLNQWNWIESLEDTFVAAGLQDVQARKPKAKISTLQANMTNIMLAQLEAGEALKKHPVLKARFEEQKVHRDRAAKEARELGTGMDLALVRCCGKKPVA